MAVQAQYPSNAFASDFRASFGVNPFDFKNIGTTAASNPQSNLTSNAPPSKKRSRDQESSAAAMAFQQQYYEAPICFSCPNPSPLSLDQAQVSTSGRIVGDDPLAQIICDQNIEIDALIRVQNERLRLGLEEGRKRQCRSLIAAFEQRVMKKLKEKEEELEAASRRSAELEEQIRQMAAENEIWFNVSKNNEAIAETLRASLEQVLVQNENANAVSNDAVKEKEGYGDSDGFEGEDDAQSCCFGGGEEEERRADGAVSMAVCCKVCGDKDVSVLLLPCRHLCLCKDCESKTATCPVCHASKIVCLQISLS